MRCAAKNLHLCRVDAFENPQCKWVPHARITDPTTKVGLHAPDILNLAPRGYSIGSSKVSSITNTAEVYVTASGNV